MARFTADVPLEMRLPGGFEIVGAAGATHRIPDALAEEFERDQGPRIPGFAWVTQDETSAIPTLPIAQADVNGLPAALTALDAAKYDKAGGTISGAVTVTGAVIAQTSVSTPALSADAANFKGRPWYDVRAYGAVADNVTNDSAAFSAAFQAARAGGGGIVNIPAGTYRLESTWWLTADGTIAGNPVGGIEIVGASPERTRLNYVGGVVAISTGTATGTGEYTQLTLRDFKVDGASSSANTVGIYIKRIWRGGEMHNVHVTNFPDAGIYLYRTYGFRVSGCFVTACGTNGTYGLTLDNANGAVIHDGTRILSNGASATGAGGGIKCFANGGTAGLGEADAGGASATITIHGCLIEDNYGRGIRFERQSQGIVQGCYIEGNGTTAVRAQVDITGTSTTTSIGVSIRDNRFQATGGINTSLRGIYNEWATDTLIDGNWFANHATAAMFLGDGGFARVGPNRANEATVVTDSQTNPKAGYYGVVVPFTLYFTISNPVASVVPTSLVPAGSVITTQRYKFPGLAIVKSVTARGNATITTGSINFFPSIGASGQSALLNVQLSNADGSNASDSAIGHVVGASGSFIGAMYSTSDDYAPATADYDVIVSGYTIHF